MKARKERNFPLGKNINECVTVCNMADSVDEIVSVFAYAKKSDCFTQNLLTLGSMTITLWMVILLNSIF